MTTDYSTGAAPAAPIRSETETLSPYWPWLLSVANKMTDNQRALDLAQEGWIAMGQAIRSYDGTAPLDYWLKFKARMQMVSKVTRAKTPEIPVSPMPPSTDGGGNINSELDDRLPRVVFDVELAYHDGDISAAIEKLTPKEREYIYRRFWKCEDYPTIAREMNSQSTQYYWRRAKAKLQEELQHLKDAV